MATSILSIWKESSKLHQFGHISIEIEDNFANTIGILLKSLISNTLETNFFPFDVDRQAEQEIIDVGASIRTMDEYYVIELYERMRNDAMKYKKNFNDFRNEMYRQAKR